MTLQYVRTEDLRRAFPGGDFRAWIARLCNDGAITAKLAERAHHEHCRLSRMTRSQRLAAAGFKRRPSWRSLPKDGDDAPEPKP